MTFTHRYDVHCSWSGSTGSGYERYGRAHEASNGQARLAISADPAFRGEASAWNPEELIVLAAASCQLLSFLAVAARARLDVVGYEDDAVGEMPEDDPPVRLTRIRLRPRIAFGGPVDEARVRRLVELAHRECYVANSLRTVVDVEPTIITPPAGDG
jgi:organic hydroperoxide reductase OsmC/OhrA